jgi:DNA (cytosine-5)-methyltransferase 1
VFISNIPIHRDGIEKYSSVWDAIGDLGDPRYPTNIPNHDYVHISDKLYNRIVRLRWGEATQFFLGRGNKVYKQFIRLHPHRISPTVMGRSRFIHPFENRILTVREQARLMSFPDNHIFKGPVENMYNQVGEAVPPILSKYIGSFIIRFLKKYSLHSPY